MALVTDLPVTFHDEATLVDGNHSFGLHDPLIPNSRIFTELYVTKKGNYNFMPAGTMSQVHPGAQLYDEGNFKNIGGGMMTFERKFAEVPPPSSEVAGTLCRTGSFTIRTSGVHFGKRFQYIGGNLAPGNDIIGIALAGNFDVFNSLRNSYIYANVITRYVDQDEFLDSTPEIMTVKANTTTTVDQTYTRVFYDKIVERIKNPLPLGSSSYLFDNRDVGSIGATQGSVSGAGALRRSGSYSDYVPYTTNVRLERRVETLTRQIVTQDASTFEDGTVFRREMIGKYLGNISIMKEYCLNGDLVLRHGKVESNDSVQEIADLVLSP